MLKAHGIVPRNSPPPETEGSSDSRPIRRKRKEMAEEEEDEQKPVVEVNDPEDEEDQRKEAQLEVSHGWNSYSAEVWHYFVRPNWRGLESYVGSVKKRRLSANQNRFSFLGEIIDLTVWFHIYFLYCKLVVIY